MKATDILVEEHRIILKMLQCLEKIADEGEEKGKLNSETARRAIDFLRNFADGCHHAKEEDRLFVVMQEHGVPKEGGPIGVMLMEHDDGRRFVRGMAQAIDGAAQGNQEAIKNFSENAHNFVALLTNHINKEDNILFPMASQVLAHQSADSLLSDFERIEAEAGGNRHSRYIEITKQLCDHYDITFVDSSQIKTIRSTFHVV